MLDIQFLRIAVTVLSFVSFVGICWWVWRSDNQTRFDRLARVCVGLDSALPVLSASGLQQGRSVSSRNEGLAEETAFRTPIMPVSDGSMQGNTGGRHG